MARLVEEFGRIVSAAYQHYKDPNRRVWDHNDSLWLSLFWKAHPLEQCIYWRELIKLHPEVTNSYLFRKWAIDVASQPINK